jgi:sensor histidine kinase regulating citrate/malate metabolism
MIISGFASRLYGSDGRVIGAIESIRDMTSIRKAESELKEAKEIAEEATKAKSEFWQT